MYNVPGTRYQVLQYNVELGLKRRGNHITNVEGIFFHHVRKRCLRHVEDVAVSNHLEGGVNGRFIYSSTEEHLSYRTAIRVDRIVSKIVT